MPHEFAHTIDDSTTDQTLLCHDGRGRGLDLSVRPDGLLGYGATADAFPADLLIPRSEWQARIEEMEATKSRLSDRCTLAGLPPKDQQQTNYCWGNSPTYCTEVIRVVQNEPLVILSAASVCAQVANYRNVGGWGKEALQFISDHGIIPESLWPANAIDRRYATDANKAAGMDNRVTGWWELEARNLDQFFSCLLRRIPVSSGLSWWSHQVSYIDPVWKDGGPAVRFRNSWGLSYGDKGYGILQGARMMPDDATAPRVVVAS